MLISIIMPMLNEEENVFPAYEKISSLMEKFGYPWELICIDDGSSDSTFEKSKELSAIDKRVKVIQLSRNFGSFLALAAGLKRSQGDVAFLVSADLQEPIGYLPEFVKKWQEGFHVVWGVRSSRDDPFTTKLFSNMFYFLFYHIGMLKNMPKQGSFVFMDRKVINALELFPEHNRGLWGLIAWMGFRQAQILCPFGKRERGKSKWTFGKKIKLAIDSIIAFSYFPIRLVSFIGFIISTMAFVYGIYIIGHAIVYGTTVVGYTTLMAAILFLSGLQLLVSGMMGEYIWRNLDEETVGFSDMSRNANREMNDE
jgi:dolichol-phosphate mannosyltransferase